MGFVTAQHGANATVATPTTVCRAGAAASEVSLYTYISKSAGKVTDKFMMPVLCLDVISGESHAPIGVFGVLDCADRSVSVAEDMIIDTEAHHLLKFGHQKDVRRDVCNVGDETGLSPSAQFNSETSNSFAESLELDQGLETLRSTSCDV